MGTYAKTDLEPMLRGDRWRGIAQIGPLLISGAAPASPVVFASIQFRKTPDSPILGHEISTEDGKILIQDAANWILSVPEQDLPLAAGSWLLELKTINAAGRVRRYFRAVLLIEPSVNF